MKQILLKAGKLSANVIPLGCVITSLSFPGKDGDPIDVVKGYKTKKEYMNQDLETNPFVGCVVGRTANRISDAKYSLNGREYQLEKNFQGGHFLHGCFSFVEWETVKVEENSVKFKYLSKNMEEGHPCDVECFVTYTLTKSDEFVIDYEYTNLDKKLDTVVNMTNHSYFNLDGSKDICDHILQIYGSQVLDCDEDVVPTGGFVDVKGTHWDFLDKKKINEAELDISYVLDGYSEGKEKKDAWLYSKKSGICMEVRSTYPGCHTYDSMYLERIEGKDGPWGKFGGICFETQGFPDAMNHENFPSVVVGPKETKKQRTVFAFSQHE